MFVLIFQNLLTLNSIQSTELNGGEVLGDDVVPGGTQSTDLNGGEVLGDDVVPGGTQSTDLNGGEVLGDDVVPGGCGTQSTELNGGEVLSDDVVPGGTQSTELNGGEVLGDDVVPGGCGTQSTELNGGEVLGDDVVPGGTQSTVLNATVRLLQKSNGKRVRNCFPCNFCEKRVLEFARHLRQVHMDKAEVKEIFSLPPKQRRGPLSLLRGKAILTYNETVKRSGSGRVIVSRRTSRARDVDEYLPCPDCKLYMVRKQLWRHNRRCPAKTRNVKQVPPEAVTRRHSVTSVAKALIEDEGCGGGKVESEFESKVMMNMRIDKVSRIVKHDSLIRKYGVRLYRRYGAYRAAEASQKMRKLGRLLLLLNTSSKEWISLSQSLSGSNFDALLSATEQLCQPSSHPTGRSTFRRPTVGLRIGEALVACAALKKREGIKCGNNVMQEEATAFLSLHDSDWKDMISCRAYISLKIGKIDKPVPLPVTSDLVKLKEYLDNQMESLVSELSHESNYGTWRTLLEITLVSIVTFNKRRGGEASKLLLRSYTDRPNWNDSANEEIVSGLSDVEKLLMKRYTDNILSIFVASGCVDCYFCHDHWC